MHKSSPILLDRLDHSLRAVGTTLKRSQLLSTLAYTLGFKNTHAFTAADKAGDMKAPAAVAIARAMLPNSEVVIIARDPLANAPFAIDESYIESSVANGDRGNAYSPSPYGHLLDLHSLADLDTSALPLLQSTPQATASSATTPPRQANTMRWNIYGARDGDTINEEFDAENEDEAQKIAIKLVCAEFRLDSSDYEEFDDLCADCDGLTLDEVSGYVPAGTLDSANSPKTGPNPVASPLQPVSDSEFNTMLAALRFWQRKGNSSDLPEWDIATNGSETVPLSNEEIDDLCERLNTQGPAFEVAISDLEPCPECGRDLEINDELAECHNCGLGWSVDDLTIKRRIGLLIPGEMDYKLAGQDGSEIRVKVKNLTVQIKQDDEGVAVDIWGKPENAESIASTWALYADANNHDGDCSSCGAISGDSHQSGCEAKSFAIGAEAQRNSPTETA